MVKCNPDEPRARSLVLEASVLYEPRRERTVERGALTGRALGPAFGTGPVGWLLRGQEIRCRMHRKGGRGRFAIGVLGEFSTKGTLRTGQVRHLLAD